MAAIALVVPWIDDMAMTTVVPLGLVTVLAQVMDDAHRAAELGYDHYWF
jgi:hypothetical protein